MCTTHSRQYSGTHRPDLERDHPHPTVHASHPAPYPFYPPVAYRTPYPPYDPYAGVVYHHQPGSFYPPPCYAHDIDKEEPATWSWSTVIFLLLFSVSLIGVVYRSLPHETRRRIAAWLPLPRGLAPQVQPLPLDFFFYLASTPFVISILSRIHNRERR